MTTCYTRKNFAPRIADLGFSMLVPDHWAEPELPPISGDWSDPSLFAPLMLAVAPMAPIILCVAARPAHSDGTLLDWVMYHVRSQGMSVGSLVEKELNGLMVITGCLYQKESDLGPRYLEVAFFEDGGRFVKIFISAPRDMERQITPVFDPILDSFRLDRPQGQNVKTMAEVSTVVEARSAPEWVEVAKRLELDGRLKEMETIIEQGVPHAAYALEIARMYRERMLRLRTAGDEAGAAQAREEAISWADSYPVMATSGGEGAAMCYQRDQFIKTL